MSVRAAVLVGAQQAAVRRRACRASTNSAQRARRRGSRRAPSAAPASASARDHQRVPGGQALVVEAGPDALARGPRRASRAPRSSRSGSIARRRRRRGGCCGPRSSARGRRPSARAAAPAFVAQHASRISSSRPDVEAALLALGVGVERGVEAALGAAHLAQRPVERLLADPPVAVVAGEPASRAGRRGPAGRCRRASSRSGGRASARRPSSGRSRRRSGRRCRRPPSRRASSSRSTRPVGRAARQQELERAGGRELRAPRRSRRCGIELCRE